MQNSRRKKTVYEQNKHLLDPIWMLLTLTKLTNNVINFAFIFFAYHQTHIHSHSPYMIRLKSWQFEMNLFNVRMYWDCLDYDAVSRSLIFRAMFANAFSVFFYFSYFWKLLRKRMRSNEYALVLRNALLIILRTIVPSSLRVWRTFFRVISSQERHCNQMKLLHYLHIHENVV